MRHQIVCLAHTLAVRQVARRHGNSDSSLVVPLAP